MHQGSYLQQTPWVASVANQGKSGKLAKNPPAGYHGVLATVVAKIV